MNEEPTGTGGGFDIGSFIMAAIAAHVSDLLKFYSYDEENEKKESWIAELPVKLPNGKIKIVLEVDPTEAAYYAEANAKVASEHLLSVHQWKEKMKENVDAGGYE